MHYKYTAKVSRESWFIRLHCWLWEADPKEIDFCKLFWGYVFAIPNIVLRVLFSPIYFLIVRPLIKRQERREQAELDTPWQQLQAERQVREARKQANKARANEFLAKVSWFFSTPPVRVIIGAVIVIALVAAAGGLGFLLYLFGRLIVEHPVESLIVVGGIIAIFAALGMVIWAGSKIRGTVFAETLLTGIKGGKHTFSGAMRHGYEGVKTNTCPKIELVD